jgi:hypothetical protein
MAWEYRAGHRYYYSATRRGGRLEKVYHGKGLAGELAAEVIFRAKRRRAEQAETLAAEKARLAPLIWAMVTLDDACRLMAEASLVAGGFHQHNYAWRRRRVRFEDRGMVPAAVRGRDPEPA